MTFVSLLGGFMRKPGGKRIGLFLRRAPRLFKYNCRMFSWHVSTQQYVPRSLAAFNEKKESFRRRASVIDSSHYLLRSRSGAAIWCETFHGTVSYYPLDATWKSQIGLKSDIWYLIICQWCCRPIQRLLNVIKGKLRSL